MLKLIFTPQKWLKKSEKKQSFYVQYISELLYFLVMVLLMFKCQIIFRHLLLLLIIKIVLNCVISIIILLRLFSMVICLVLCDVAQKPSITVDPATPIPTLQSISARIV